MSVPRHRLVGTMLTGSLLAASLSGCGLVSVNGPTSTDSATATPSPTSPATAIDSGSTTTESAPTNAMTEASGDPSPQVSLSSTDQVISPDLSGQKLTLARFFRPVSGWTENRYNIADRKDIQGMAVQLNTCYQRDAEELELRLGNAFSSLSFSAGQSNGSNTSDQVLVVEVLGNNEQLDVRRVPFNRIQKLVVPVKGVNALKIRLYLDRQETGCGSDYVQPVIFDVVPS